MWLMLFAIVCGIAVGIALCLQWISFIKNYTRLFKNSVFRFLLFFATYPLPLSFFYAVLYLVGKTTVVKGWINAASYEIFIALCAVFFVIMWFRIYRILIKGLVSIAPKLDKRP
jgi:hypothetical protein